MSTWTSTKTLAAAHVERCGSCGKGVKVSSRYEIGGVSYDDSYCGHCGKNWPKAKLAANDRED